MLKIVIGALSILAASPLFAESDSKNNLVAAVIDLPPYGCSEEVGFCYHNRFFSSLERYLSQQINQVTLPYARSVVFAKTGQANLVLIGENKDLDASTVRLGTIYTLEFSLVSTVAIQSINDFRKQRIGVVRSAKRTVSRITSVSDESLIEVDNYQVGFAMMQKGRLDAMFTPRHSAQLSPSHAMTYLGPDFGKQPWILDVVLYCHPSLCHGATTSKMVEHVQIATHSFLLD